MSDKVESANLILKLYDLRREEVMRQARQWYFGEFHLGSFEEVSAAMLGEKSAYFRMVTTYWDMACSFVVHGALDAEMFNAANGEHIGVYAKLEPFINEIRQKMGAPTYLQHLEQVVTNLPDAQERMTRMREMLKQMAAARAQAANTQ